MTQVVITGWNVGLRKVALTKLLQKRAGLSLSVAKDAVDRCVDGETVVINLPSREDAEAFARDASALGAIVELDPVPQR